MRPLSDVLLDTLLDLLPPVRLPPGEPHEPQARKDRGHATPHGGRVERVEGLQGRDRLRVPDPGRQRH
jgi:hypothetical protein